MHGAKNIKKKVAKTVHQNVACQDIFLSVFIKELHGGVCEHKYPGTMKLTSPHTILHKLRKEIW
jgi:hypothetical protein